MPVLQDKRDEADGKQNSYDLLAGSEESSMPSSSSSTMAMGVGCPGENEGRLLEREGIAHT